MGEFSPTVYVAVGWWWWWVRVLQQVIHSTNLCMPSKQICQQNWDLTVKNIFLSLTFTDKFHHGYPQTKTCLSWYNLPLLLILFNQTTSNKSVKGTHTHTLTNTHAHAYICTHSHIHVRACAHTHTHTHKQRKPHILIFVSPFFQLLCSTLAELLRCIFQTFNLCRANNWKHRGQHE